MRPKSKSKRECDKCGKLHRNRSLHLHKPTGEMRCKICLNRYGEHKFYVPKEKHQKNEVIGKFNITFEERRRLFTQLIRQGLTKEQANNRINYTIYQMRKNKYKRKPTMKDINKEFKKEFRKLKKND